MAMLVPQQAIKFSPLHLVNFYPTIELSFEQKVAQRVGIQLEGGYVLNYNNDIDGDFRNKRGTKLKLEGRYYFFGRIDRRKLFYVAAETYVNIINFDRNTRVEECFDIDCDHVFRRTVTGKMAYREKGFTLKAGMVKYFWKFFFDLNSGWSVRDINYRELTDVLPDDDEWFFFDVPNEQDRVILGPNVGARIGYRFR